MTAVVGLIDKERIWIGADSAASSDNLVVERSDEKVFQVNEYLVGIAGSFRMGNLLRYSILPAIESQHQDVDNETFIHTSFINTIQEGFNSFKFSYREQEEAFGGIFLVGYRGTLFAVHDDFHIGTYKDNYAALGSGREYCYGSLYSTKSLPSKERVLTALGASVKYCPTVSDPFVVKSIGR